MKKNLPAIILVTLVVLIIFGANYGKYALDKHRNKQAYIEAMQETAPPHAPAPAAAPTSRTVTGYCLVVDPRGKTWVAPVGGTFEGEWFTFKDLDGKKVSVRPASVEQK